MALAQMAAPPCVVFDVNETLLDLETLEPTFERIFGDKLAMRLWFANLILYSAALTVAKAYVPFTDIADAVMKMLADVRGVKVSERDQKRLTEKFSTMPPHPEVARLRCRSCAPPGSGCSLSPTISSRCRNASSVTAESSICSRGASAPTACHRHKPAPETYASVEKALGAKPSDFCLIASHTWDTLGAVAAGWQAALIKRPWNDVLGVGPQPQIVGLDLDDVADQLIIRRGAKP